MPPPWARHTPNLQIPQPHIHKLVYKTIGLDESAYNMLKAAKGPGESFSETVRRLLTPHGSWRDLIGILSDDGDAMAKWLQEHRAAERAAARDKWLR